MKSCLSQEFSFAGKSRPARALWIEISPFGRFIIVICSRGPRGPCGLKFKSYNSSYSASRRGPRGPCGLKSVFSPAVEIKRMSRPARALWIEIPPRSLMCVHPPCRGPRGPCGLKSLRLSNQGHKASSRPARALWIEILDCGIIASNLFGRGPRGPCGLKWRNGQGFWIW